MRDLISTQRPVQRDDISDRRYAGRQSAGVSGARSPWLVMVGGRQATQHVGKRRFECLVVTGTTIV